MKIEADKIRKLSCWHTGAQSGSGQGDMECLSVLRRKPTHRRIVRVWSGWYGVPVYTEKEAYTQVYSQGDMESLSVLRRKPTHRCTVRVQSGWYGVPVCTEKEAYTQVYSQGDMECLSVLRRKPTHRCTVRVIWSACLYWEGSLHTGVQSGWYGVPVCTEKEAYTQVYSQGDGVPVCTEKEAYTQVYSQGPVRVIWSACQYWEGSLTEPVGAYHNIECPGFQARVQTMSAWLTTPTTCWTH